MKSYLPYLTNKGAKDYIIKQSYISESSHDNLVSDLYYTLPEEYDVFTYVDSSYFNKRETKQQELISDCLIYMRKALLSLSASSGIVSILPKLHVSNDDNGTITFNLAYSTFRAFLSFDDKKGNYDSYYGIVFQSDDDKVSTRTGRIDESNYKSAIDEWLGLVISNS
jgi:hypothetical protein